MYLRKYGHLVQVKRLGRLPGNSVGGLTDRHDMTLIVFTPKQTNRRDRADQELQEEGVIILVNSKFMRQEKS